MFISTYLINSGEYTVNLGYNERLQGFWLIIPDPNVIDGPCLFNNMFDWPGFCLTIQDLKEVLKKYGIKIPEKELQALYQDALKNGYFSDLESEDFGFCDHPSNFRTAPSIPNVSGDLEQARIGVRKVVGDHFAFWIFLPVITIAMFYFFNKFTQEIQSKKPEVSNRKIEVSNTQKIKKTPLTKASYQSADNKQGLIDKRVEKLSQQKLTNLPAKKSPNAKPKTKTAIPKKRDKELESMVEFIKSEKMYDLMNDL